MRILIHIALLAGYYARKAIRFVQYQFERIVIWTISKEVKPGKYHPLQNVDLNKGSLRPAVTTHSSLSVNGLSENGDQTSGDIQIFISPRRLETNDPIAVVNYNKYRDSIVDKFQPPEDSPMLAPCEESDRV